METRKIAIGAFLPVIIIALVFIFSGSSYKLDQIKDLKARHAQWLDYKYGYVSPDKTDLSDEEKESLKMDIIQKSSEILTANGKAKTEFQDTRIQVLESDKEKDIRFIEGGAKDVNFEQVAIGKDTAVIKASYTTWRKTYSNSTEKEYYIENENVKETTTFVLENGQWLVKEHTLSK